MTIGRHLVRGVALALVATLGGALPSASTVAATPTLGAPFPALESLAQAVHDLAPAGASFTVGTVPAAESGPFARANVERIEVDPAALALVTDLQSARALAALLLSYYAMPDPSRFNANPLKPGTVAAAAGAILLGTKVVDPIDRKQFGNSGATFVGYNGGTGAGDIVAAAGGAALGVGPVDPGTGTRSGYEHDPRFTLGWFPPTREEPEAGVVRASRMLAMLGQAGGCSGPLADLLNRAEKLGSGEAAALSRRVRKDLGKSIYPPDYSCAG